MRIPRAIIVGPHTYKIVRKQLERENGDCDVDALEIQIANGLKKSKAQEIVVHELLHACCHPNFLDAEKYTEEQFVTGVAPALLQVLRQNPKLVEYLTS